MTLILVEGLDRAGKTTRCRELMAEPRSRPRLMLHFVAPPKMADKRAASLMVLEEIVTAYGLAAKNPDVDFVLDRGHVSWLSYEVLLRGGTFAPEMQRRLEDVVDGRVEYVEVRDPLALARRDDGLSTYTPKGGSPLQRLRDTAHNIEREQATFAEVLAFTAWPVTRVVTG